MPFTTNLAVIPAIVAEEQIIEKSTDARDVAGPIPARARAGVRHRLDASMIRVVNCAIAARVAAAMAVARLR